MPESVRVFVSHHHSPEEDVFTARLVSDLRAAGADVWVDTAGIASDDFVKKISEGLAGRQWLVLVMTPAALASPWVQREVNAALNEHTAGRMLGVLPLVARPCREQDIPVLWRTREGPWFMSASSVPGTRYQSPSHQSPSHQSPSRAPVV